MEDFDNMFKKHFKNEQEGLPGNEEAQLWDSIVEDLGPQNSIVKSTSRFWNKKWIFTILGVGVVLGAYFIGQYQGMNTNLYTENSSYDKELIATNENQSSSKEILLNENDFSSLNEETNNRNNISTSSSYTSKTSTVGNENLNSKASDFKQSKQIDLTNDNNLGSSINREVTETVRKNNLPIKIANITRIDNAEPLNFDNQTNESNLSTYNSSAVIDEEKFSIDEGNSSIFMKTSQINLNNKSGNINSSEKINEDLTAVDKQLNSSIINRELQSAELINNLPVAFIKEKNHSINPVLSPILPKGANVKFNLGFISGFNKSGINYYGTDKDLITRKNASEKSYYGYDFGIDLEAIYKGKWLFQTGIHYENQRTIFNETWIKDIQREAPNSGVVVDPITYRISENLTSDTTLIYKSVNRLQQVNSFNSISIPFQLGWKSSHHNFSYGVLGGANIRIRQSQSGLLLNQDAELVELKDGGNHFYNRINIGLNVSPFVQYKISSSIGLRASYSIDIYNPTVSINSNYNLLNYTQSLNVGVRYFINE